MNNGLLKRLIAPVIAIAGGILFIVLGCIGLSQVNNFPEVQATIVSVNETTETDADGDTSTKVEAVVSYTVDGTEYEETLDEAPTGLSQGETITVRYNPEKPEYVTATTKKAGFVKLGFGILIVVLGIVSLLRSFIFIRR